MIDLHLREIIHRREIPMGLNYFT